MSQSMVHEPRDSRSIEESLALIQHHVKGLNESQMYGGVPPPPPSEQPAPIPAGCPSVAPYLAPPPGFSDSERDFPRYFWSRAVHEPSTGSLLSPSSCASRWLSRRMCNLRCMTATSDDAQMRCGTVARHLHARQGWSCWQHQPWRACKCLATVP